MPDWVEAAKALPDVRWDKVARIREALDAGSYDVDARLNDLLADLPDELALLRRTGS
ncbi:MAG TPA: flagellar biosynthesis anti-sigma factor FlgM [Phycisphaerae bacterium]|nr:flagellar biosynthesis anti-sigma factor FlgM [Phycisphaerae bacterium]